MWYAITSMSEAMTGSSPHRLVEDKTNLILRFQVPREARSQLQMAKFV